MQPVQSVRSCTGGNRCAAGLRRGNVLLVMVITMPALFAIISLAVDFGRVQIARSELRDATDAAVRYASSGLAAGPATVRSRAKTAALENRVLGAPLVLLDSDIQLGTWDANARTFTLLSGAAESTANAVRIVASRSSARGTSVPLTFGGAIGLPNVNLQVTSTARISATEVGAGFGVFGRDGIEMQNNARIDSYDSSAGAYTAHAASSNAEVNTNNAFEMKNNAQVRGNGRAGPGESIEFSNNASVTGNTASLSSERQFDVVSTATVSASNNNASLASAYFNNGSRKFSMQNNTSYTMPAGTYYLDDIELKNNAQLSFAGEVTIYTTGKIELRNNVTMNAYNHRPGNLRIYMTGDTIELKNNAKLEAYLYAPDSGFEIDNNAELSGVLVAKQIEMKNNSKIHQDLSLSGTGGAGGGASATVALVE